MNEGSTVIDCTASYNGGDGISSWGGIVSHCAVSYNVANGIQISANGQVLDCSAQNNGNGGAGAGIRVSGSGSRIDGNNVTANDWGIDVSSANNIVVRNTASGNSTNFNIVGGNSVGTITNTPVGAGAWNNFTY